jgi:tetratricopeptide (TPR) repeat protein
MASRRLVVGRAIVVALVVMVAVPPLRAAEAQETDNSAMPRAKALFQRAERYFFIGEFKRALDLYNEAFRTRPLPGFLFNIGQCQRKLGDCKRAIFNFKQYLLHQPDAPNRGVAEQLIALCEAKIASDREARQRATAQAKPPVAPTAPPADSGRLNPLWFWTTAGLAVALLATGAATGAVALNKSADYKDPATPIPRKLELRDEAAPFRPLSTATFIAGGVAAVGAGVLYYLTWMRGEQEPAQEMTAPVSAGILPGGGALVFQGSF